MHAFPENKLPLQYCFQKESIIINYYKNKSKPLVPIINILRKIIITIKLNLKNINMYVLDDTIKQT